MVPFIYFIYLFCHTKCTKKNRKDWNTLQNKIGEEAFNRNHRAYNIRLPQLPLMMAMSHAEKSGKNLEERAQPYWWRARAIIMGMALVTCQYPDLLVPLIFEWSKVLTSQKLYTQIWLALHHQYGISAFFPQMDHYKLVFHSLTYLYPRCEILSR